MKSRLDVSVCIPTYFHEKYITLALESVLTQKTNYTYEIVISDDGSQDGTMDIVLEYKERYPELFVVNHNKKNIGIPENFFKARCMCKGKYILMLAGDDYLISEREIELKVNFLKKHKEYFAVTSRYMMYDDEKGLSEIAYPPRIKSGRGYKIKDFEKGIFPCGRGMMIRNVFLKKTGRDFFSQTPERYSKIVDDATDPILFLMCGPIYCLPNITRVYRRSPKTKSMSYNSTHSVQEIIKNNVIALNNFYKDYGEQVNVKRLYVYYFALAILNIRNYSDYVFYNKLYKSIPYEYQIGLSSVSKLVPVKICCIAISLIKGKVKNLITII